MDIYTLERLQKAINAIKTIGAQQSMDRNQRYYMGSASEFAEYVRQMHKHMAHSFAAHITRGLADEIGDYIGDKLRSEEILETGDIRYRAEFAVLTRAELDQIKMLLSMLMMQAAGPSAAQPQTKPPTYPEVVEVLSLPAPKNLLPPPEE